MPLEKTTSKAKKSLLSTQVQSPGAKQPILSKITLTNPKKSKLTSSFWGIKKAKYDSHYQQSLNKIVQCLSNAIEHQFISETAEYPPLQQVGTITSDLHSIFETSELSHLHDFLNLLRNDKISVTDLLLLLGDVNKYIIHTHHPRIKKSFTLSVILMCVYISKCQDQATFHPIKQKFALIKKAGSPNELHQYRSELSRQYSTLNHLPNRALNLYLQVLCLEKAVELGCAEANYALSLLYDQGLTATQGAEDDSLQHIIVFQVPEAASTHLQVAADKGHIDAQIKLATTQLQSSQNSVRYQGIYWLALASESSDQAKTRLENELFKRKYGLFLIHSLADLYPSLPDAENCKPLKLAIEQYKEYHRYDEITTLLERISRSLDDLSRKSIERKSALMALHLMGYSSELLTEFQITCEELFARNTRSLITIAEQIKAVLEKLVSAQLKDPCYYLWIEIYAKFYVQCLHKGHEEEITEATFLLGCLYANGFSISAPSEVGKTITKDIITQNLETATSLLIQAAEENFPAAEYELGLSYQSIQSSIHAQLQAITYLMRCAEKGYEPGISRLVSQFADRDCDFLLPQHTSPQQHLTPEAKLAAALYQLPAWETREEKLDELKRIISTARKDLENAPGTLNIIGWCENKVESIITQDIINSRISYHMKAAQELAEIIQGLTFVLCTNSQISEKARSRLIKLSDTLSTYAKENAPNCLIKHESSSLLSILYDALNPSIPTVDKSLKL